MKIDLVDRDYFNGDYHFSVVRKENIGTFDSDKNMTASDLLDSRSNNISSYSLEDINSLNIIINNNDCGDSFFHKVCSVLEEDGIEFRTVYGALGEDIENSTIITLDMQYSAGINTLFFAPFDNTRIGYSDSLVLAMKSGFEQNGFTSNQIVSGMIGFRTDADGNVVHSVPTPAEEEIDSSQNVSFVTISFGTSMIQPELVAKSIESGLLRQKSYLDHYDTGTDLIYKASDGDEIQAIADYFGSSVKDLTTMNSIRNAESLDDTAIINPDVSHMPVFDSSSTFQLENEFHKIY